MFTPWRVNPMAQHGVTSIFGFFSTPSTSKRLISLTALAVHCSLSGGNLGRPTTI